MRVSERLAHVAASLRDAGGGFDQRRAPQFGWIRIQDGEFRVGLEYKRMERVECESRRDSPTWPRLSETRGVV